MSAKLKENPEFIVSAQDTLLPFLRTQFQNKSRNYVKGLLTRRQITVDGKVCTDHARPLKPGQRVRVLLYEVPVDKVGPLIIYEDDDLLVIDKPAGMLAIATDKERENTAYHMVTEYMRGRAGAGRVFIVHRLDRDTSGVMLFAKSERVKLALQDNWETAAIRRGYLAAVEGVITPAEGEVRSWLKQTKTLLVYSSKNEGDGKLAVTHYSTLNTADEFSLLDVSLKTGRKNQIRVHMSDLGHPVVGDKKYGAKADPLGRLGLHASTLVLEHPTTGAEMRLEAKTPRAFTKLFSGR